MRPLSLVLLVSGIAAQAAQAQVIYKVRIRSSEGERIVELSAERYVAAVLAGESSVFRSDEALKAMAVAARTYAARSGGRHSSQGFDFCETTHCQHLDLSGITPQFSRAAEATAGQLLWFEGRPAFAVYTRDCGGMSENVEAVWPDIQAAYLKARADAYCTRNGAAVWSWTADSTEIISALKQSRLLPPESIQRINIQNRTESGRAKTLLLEGNGAMVPISASSFRFAVGRSLGWNTLRSDRYEVASHNGRIHFEGRGEGHGVGLCQHGADQMGREGFTYREILAFYYPGTTIGLTATGLSWTRMGGENIVLFSTQPDRDRDVLALAENLDRDVAEQLRATSTGEIEIRVYPDIDTFRNATGEPGWVAAHTSGFRIELQPAEVLRTRGVLRQILRHELLHVVIESQAAPGLPVWFREGLVEYLNEPASRPQQNTVRANDDDLRQREVRSRAERGYSEARSRVAMLIHRYGEDSVLGWLKRGLPEEVTNSSARSAPTNNR